MHDCPVALSRHHQSPLRGSHWSFPAWRSGFELCYTFRALDGTSSSALPRRERPAIQVRTAMDSQQGSDAVILNLPEPARDSSLRRTWRAWGDSLRRRHLDGLGAALLDASGPLALVTSQLLHFGRPLLGDVAAHLATILESESETAAFRDYLSGTRMDAETADKGDT